MAKRKQITINPFILNKAHGYGKTTVCIFNNGMPVNLVSDIFSQPIGYNMVVAENTVSVIDEPTVTQENFVMQPIPQTNENTSDNLEPSTNQNPVTPIQSNIYNELQELLQFVGLAWLIVCVLLLTKKLVSYFRFCRYVKSSIEPICNKTLMSVYADVCQSLKSKELPLFTHQTIHSPMLIGFLKPMVVLPEKYIEDEEHLKYVFLHEITHYKRLDIFYKWLVQIVLCIHWFNPMVYLVCREVNTACELSCDEAVIKNLNSQEQRAYGDTLLRSLEMLGNHNKVELSLTLAENAKSMKERLGAIMNFRKKTKFAVLLTALLTLVLSTGAAFAGVQAAPISNQKVTPAINMTKNTVSATIDLGKTQASMMNLDIYYELNKGKLGLILVSPDGKLVYSLSTRSQYNETVTLPVDKGLWSLIMVSESDTGVISGTQKIKASIASGENFVVPMDIPMLKANEKTKFGPYYLNKNETISIDITSWSGNGKIFVANEKEGEDFDLYYLLDKKADSFAFVADESRYYYITIGNVNTVGSDNDVGVTNIKGKITLNMKGTSKSSMIPLPQLPTDISAQSKDTEPYDNECINIMENSGTWGDSVNRLLPNMSTSAVEKVVNIYLDKHLFPGITTPEGAKQVEATIKPALQYMTTEAQQSVSKKISAFYKEDTQQETSKNDIRIPIAMSANGEKVVANKLGKLTLVENDLVTVNLTWTGTGDVMFFYTKNEYTDDELKTMRTKNSAFEFSGFMTVSQTSPLYSSDPLSLVDITMQGEYNMYVIALNEKNLSDIKGEVIISKKYASTSSEKLDHMSTWSGTVGEKKTATGTIITAENYTGDKINYEFSSENNGSKVLKLNSSLTGNYEIIFISSDRTILKRIPSFTGNKDIILSGLPKDTISMIVRSNNVSGTLSVDNASQSELLYEGSIAANNHQIGNTFQAKKGDVITLNLIDELTGWQLNKDSITIKIVIGGNDGTTQEVFLSNKKPQASITIKENAIHHITIYNSQNQLINYKFLLKYGK